MTLLGSRVIIVDEEGVDEEGEAMRVEVTMQILTVCIYVKLALHLHVGRRSC